MLSEHDEFAWICRRGLSLSHERALPVCRDSGLCCIEKFSDSTTATATWRGIMEKRVVAALAPRALLLMRMERENIEKRVHMFRRQGL